MKVQWPLLTCLGVVILIGFLLYEGIRARTRERERDEARAMFVGVCRALEAVSDTSFARLKRGESNALISVGTYPTSGRHSVSVVWRNLSDRTPLEFEIEPTGEVVWLAWGNSTLRYPAYINSRIPWEDVFK